MVRPDFDVIVAGAGAGGATAAYYLVQAGLRVLVVEKVRLPRYKACGGAIPRQTLARFPFDWTPVIEAAPASVRLTFPGFPAVDLPLPDEPVVMVMRSRFDAALLAHSGAEVEDGMAVSGVTETVDQVRVEVGDRDLTARYLVGADGAVSTVARCLGLRLGCPLGGSLEAEVALDGQDWLAEEYGHRAVFAMGAATWGYAWVFPRGDHLSVGIAHLRQGRADLRTALQRAMDHLGISLDGVRLHGHPLPYYQAPAWPWWRRQVQERLSTRRCVLVGDAAGLLDPFIGEGIRYAVASARLAAEGIIKEDLSEYEAAVWREIGHSLATAGLTASVYYRYPRLCYRLGVGNPRCVDRILDVLVERDSYLGICRELIAATTLWLLGDGRPR